jgi:2-keto-4-pentenoate hydratase
MQRGQTDRIEAAGRFLFEAHRAKNSLAALPPEIAPRSVAEAYGVQDFFVALCADERGPVAGYKIALTTPQMQRMVGLSEPISGAILESTVKHAPAAVRAADFGRLLVEFEIALELGEDLPAANAPFTRESVSQAVEAVMPAFEIADDRNADYKDLSKHALLLVADNAWNEGAVLGEPVRDWRGIDLANLRGAATINEVGVGEGRGGDSMGHPLEALAWLANHLAEQGRGLLIGNVVLTGSLVTSKFVKAGDRVEFDAGPLGSIRLNVT